MKIINLIENTPGAPGCAYEHGLSFYIETGKHKILVDTGASGAFADNAQVLGIDLTQVDLLFLSHGHYDHSGGIMRFAEINPHAKIIMQEGALEGYYHLYPNDAKYIGVDRAGIMSLPGLELISGNVEIDEELKIFTGVTGRKLWPKGNRELVMATDVDWVQDEFRHEQYLVIECEGKKILVSGCAHNGILNILEEYERLYGGAPDVVISGFHMMQKNGYDEEDVRTIREIAHILKDTTTMYYTGHCTGEEPFNIMKEIMGDKVVWVHSGEEIIELAEAINI